MLVSGGTRRHAATGTYRGSCAAFAQPQDENGGDGQQHERGRKELIGARPKRSGEGRQSASQTQ